MLVVVLVVCSVPAAVVNVVDVIAVRDRHMAAAFTVDMLMVLMHSVTVGWFTFVVMIVMPPVKMSVMHVVDMIPVRDRDMPTPVAMGMVMFGMLIVNFAGHHSHRRSDA
ncbi:MAG: hypothetical protein JWR32_174 [Mycobacterium sp.]|nr:hypothetical protein [Mycobacterium sp.]